MRIKYFIKWSFKQFKSFPVQTAINILGLSLGLTVFALISSYVWHQKQVDTFHSNLNHIYRAENNFYGITPATYLDFYRSQIPEIKDGCRFGKTNSLLHYQSQNKTGSQQGIYSDIMLTDSSFFNIFSYPLLSGNPSETFIDPNVIILTKTLSEKLFGDEDPYGKTVRFNGNHQLKVVGIMSDFNGNSSLTCEAVVPFDFYKVWFQEPNTLDRWNRWMYETHFLFHDNVDPLIVKAKMDSLLGERYVTEYDVSRDDLQVDQTLRPYKEIYLSDIGDRHKHGNKKHILIFSIIAVFVLIIACINYINISTAVAANRFKTLGVKRINGATRGNLIKSILFEGVLIAFLSVVISVVLVEFILPYFKELTDLDIQIPYSLPLMAFVFIGVPIVLGIISSIYPAYYITNFDLIDVLQGKFVKGKSGSLFRKVLIILQFSISVFLIIGTITVKKQLSFITDFDPGYKMNQVIYTKLNPTINNHFDVLKSRILENPNVLGLTRCNSNIMSSGSVWTVSDGEDKSITVPQFSVDEDFFDFFDISITWGRGFTSEDLKNKSKLCIINQKLADWYGGVDTLFTKKIYDEEIIGVIENIQIDNLHQELQPMTVSLDPDNTHLLYYKINAENYKETLKYISEIWKEIAPEFPFEYHFMEDEFENLYETEIQFSKVFTVFSILSIFIACMGLFAMSSFIALKRTKEIGIRKSHGASIGQILILLSKEFTVLVLVANIIAIPLAWFYLKNWLNSFAYKTELSWWVYALAAFISLIIALITVYYHTIKTAQKNPVESLRYE
jgi:ABC-type antimicrobial peptide transport system permease subunit